MYQLVSWHQLAQHHCWLSFSWWSYLSYYRFVVRPDAFIGSSLLSSFGFAPVLAFLVIGPMLDVKNLLMMKNYLKTRFIWQFMTIVTLVVSCLFLYSWGEAMIRFFILFGYFILTLYLQLSGKLNQYLNLHYSYLAYITMVLSLLLAIVQAYICFKRFERTQSLYIVFLAKLC